MRAVSASGCSLTARPKLQSTQIPAWRQAGGGACTHEVNNEHKHPINLMLNGGDEVGDGGEGARGGRPLAKALNGQARHLPQPVDVGL